MLPPSEESGVDLQQRRITTTKRVWRKQRLIPTRPENDDEPASLETVLEAEFAALHPDAEPPQPSGAGSTRLASLFAAVHRLTRTGTPRTALCFSGGGIRSATFCLGALQGLARCGLLTRFDYLSTVSGGGFIGSWLSAWLTRSSLAQVQRELAGETATLLQPEPEPVEHLREYSNYLTPKLGFLSADAWTVWGIVLRNLLLNWLLLVPILTALLFVPRLLVAALELPILEVAADSVGLVAVGLALWALSYVGLDLPSLGNNRWTQRRFLSHCLFPLIAAILGGILFWGWHGRTATPVALPVFLLGGCAFHLIASGLSHLRIRHQAARSGRRVHVSPILYLVNGLTGALGGLALWWLSRGPLDLDRVREELPAYVVFAPGLLLLTVAGLTTLFIGFTSWRTSESDREWLARAGAWVLIVVVTWTTFSAISLFGPPLALIAVDGLPRFDIMAGLASLTGVSGLLTAALGYGHQTPATGGAEARSPRARIPNALLKLAAPVFVLALLVLLSLLSTTILGSLAPPIDPESDGYRVRLFRAAIWTLVILGGFAALASHFIHVNKFSLHSMYRNRLVRAYLGASCPAGQRKPSFFSGYSDADDMPIATLSDAKPFHVINVALNLVHGRQLAWQERKATSFTVSRLHAGNAALGYRSAKRYGDGITLGTAAAISGAAASPNMGYHSSSVITFLMTFFNVRLGWWLGNPGEAGWSTWSLEGPRIALRPIISEALGRTDDLNPYVYLSDGGHFENLGLYEMVRRRCHLILLCDAGHDEQRKYGDLGNAIRKIRVDLGIPITFSGSALPGGQGLSGYGAVGTITYSCVDPGAPDGILIYVKPSLNGSEPMDLQNYQKQNPEFPNQPTSDQWFDESQFESYRALGSHIMGTVCPAIAKHLPGLSDTNAGPRGDRVSPPSSSSSA